VNSSNSGAWPGSRHPCGLCMTAIETDEVPVFTRPTNSEMVFGGSPAAGTSVGASIRRGTAGR
jgi:hypothetical protein